MELSTMEHLNESFEPMDVDLSINSSGRMDFSYNYVDKQENYISFAPSDGLVNTGGNNELPAEINQVSVVKKYHINIQRTQSNVWTRIYVTSLIVFAISIISYNITNIQCINDVNFLNIRETLSSKIYGQDIAIEQLSEALEANYKKKILFLYGGTGVGKTYSISLLMQDMWDSANVYHFTTSSFMKTFTTELCFGMTLCKSSVFIIDDLSTNEINIKNTISDIVSKSDKLDKSVLIILIFNCDSKGTEFVRKCDDSFLKDLDLNFSDINIYKKFIPFQALKKEHLIKCVQTELGEQRNNILDVDHFLKNFEVERDGCKGVYTKIKLLKHS